MAMSRTEITVCTRIGVSPSEYIIARRARTLGVSINAAGGFVLGGRGRQVIDESSERLRGTGELPGHKDKTTGAGALLAEASERLDAAVAAYAENPESEAAWRGVGDAAAFLEEALERFAPAYANRLSGSDEDGGGSPAYDAMQTRIGRAIERVANPMLRAAGGAGVTTVGRPLPLTETELAVCARMGISPESYLETKARQRR